MEKDKRWVTALDELTFAVIDLETTGLHANRGDAVCEVGLVKVEGWSLTPIMSELVNPQKRIPPSAGRVHGITDAMVSIAPPIDQILPIMKDHFEGCVLAAYNAPFELGFLGNAFREKNIHTPSLPCLDLFALARAIVISRSGYALRKIAPVLGIEDKQDHRALGDALIAGKVLQALAEILRFQGVENLLELKNSYGEHIVFEANLI